MLLNAPKTLEKSAGRAVAEGDGGWDDWDVPDCCVVCPPDELLLAEVLDPLLAGGLVPPAAALRAMASAKYAWSDSETVP